MTRQRSAVLDLLQVRSSEADRALALTLLMLLACVGGAIASPGTEALFYARFGVQYLPYMYMALGLVTATTSLVITGLLSRLSKSVLYHGFPLILAALLFIGRGLISTGWTWVYPALWLLTYLTWSLQFFLIWGLAGSVFDTRQAKRLFPLFAAGGILGSATGGLITKPLVRMIGAENLLLAWAAAFVFGFFIIRHIWAAAGSAPPVRRRRGSLLADVQRGFRFVRRSRLMSWMSWTALLLGVLLFAVLFPFSKAVAANFPNEDELAGFLGSFGGAATVVAFVLSLLITNRLFARLGFMGGLLAFPGIYLLGFAALVAWPVFTAIAALRFMQLVWRLGVADTAFQATFNVVPPEWREATRAFISGVPQQAGVVLAGMLLLLTERSLQPVQSYLLGVGLAAACLYTVWRGRAAYRESLEQALEAGRPHVFFAEDRPFGGFQSDAAAVAVAVDGLSNADPVTRRIAAEVLGSLQLPELTGDLVAALDDPDPAVRVASLRALGRAGASDSLLEVAMRLKDPEPEVRLQSVRSLRALAAYPAGLQTMLEPTLQDPSLEVRCWAAAAMLKAGEHAAARQALADMYDAPDPLVRMAVLEAVAEIRHPIALDFAIDSLGDPHPSVRRQAAAALAGADPATALPLLVERLADEDRAVRNTAADGLAVYSNQAVAPVMATLGSPAFEAGALTALARLPVERVRGELTDFAARKQQLATEYDLLGHGLRGFAANGDRLELLWSAVRAAAVRQARMSIEAIGLVAGTSTGVAIENLESSDQAQRANAIEMLASLRDRRLIAPLLRIWEPDPTHAEQTEQPSVYLARALEDRDDWVRACAAFAASEIHQKSLAVRLRELAEGDSSSLVREAAGLTLNGGQAMEGLSTLSTMERILFLKHVPMFADLPPGELIQIAGISRELLFDDEELIAAQGEIGAELFIIVQGEVEVTARDDSGTEQQIARRGHGEYVGEMSIISHEPRMATLTARGQVRVLSIGQKEFEGIIRDRPATSLAVMRELIRRLKVAQGGALH